MIKVYAHRRKDTNEIFYIGHGASSRPWQFTRGRSQAWQAIFQQAGCTVEIVNRYDEKELAAAHEVLLIAACREAQIPIVNKKSGGYDRNEGIPLSSAHRAKISAARYINNGSAKQVKTPLGTFKSMAAAARAHNLSIDQLYYRVQNKPHFELV